MRLLLAAALSIAMLPATARAAVTVSPVMDAFTSTANPTGNFGGGGIIAVASSSLPKGGFSGVMQFDFAAARSALDASYPGGWSITSVVMTMTVSTGVNAVFNAGSAAGSFNATWLAGDGWTEGSGTPNAPGASGINGNSLTTLLGGTTESLGTFAYDGLASGNSLPADARDISLGLTPGFLADISNGSLGTIAFGAADSTINMFFNSRSFNPNTAARPFLTINAVGTAPEPGRASLLCLALTAMTLPRRRRSRL